MNANMYCLLCFIISFFACAALTAWIIPRLRAMKMGQKILEIGPVWHAKKEGTPTMGGIVFLVVTIPLTLLLCLLILREESTQSVFPFALTVLFCVANGTVGIVDDLTKLRHKTNEGLTPTQKLILQTTLSAAYLALLRIADVLDNAIYIPLVGEVPLGFASYFLLLIYLVGITNCANLTDGIDGLAAAVGSVIFIFLAFLSVYRGEFGSSLIASMALGCTLSFLFFNRHPAKIFMGDTGSLFIGSAAAAIPILLKLDLLGIIFGIIYVFEGVSVILQVLYYKGTKKRLFLMAPIHHHFERCGWSENKIVVIFSISAAAACALALFLA